MLLTNSTLSSTSPHIDIVNLSDKEIPSDVKMILSYGPKFALHINKLNPSQLFRLIADLEAILNTLGDINLKNNIRCDLVNIMNNFMNSPANISTATPRLLNKCFNSAKISSMRIKIL